MTDAPKMSPQEAVEILMEHTTHDSTCVRSRWCAGQPTPDGGYEEKFGEVWFQSRPVDNTPKCECGLAEAIAALDGMNIFWSRFKQGDRIWLVEEYLDGSGKHLVTEKPRTINHVDSRSRLWFEGSFPRFAYESDCFPTKAEAEAECEKRNRGE